MGTATKVRVTLLRWSARIDGQSQQLSSGTLSWLREPDLSDAAPYPLDASKLVAELQSCRYPSSPISAR